MEDWQLWTFFWCYNGFFVLLEIFRHVPAYVVMLAMLGGLFAIYAATRPWT